VIAEERHAILIQQLNETRYVQVTELADHFGVSAATIRRDLSLLEQKGLCIRKRGGAIPCSQGVTLEIPYELKKNQNLSEKRRIAERAAEFVEDGNTLILDAGSTTYALALLLRSKQRITVVTNDLQIAVTIASNPNITLVCTGGIARPYVYSLQGSQVESFIRDLRVDKTFLGADAIHPDCSISNVNLEEVPIKQAMARAAKQVFSLADSTKFEKTGFAKVCDLSDINAVITDSGISKEKLAKYKSLGHEIIVV
jgi:DeoR/GlpR family transcriptional regulator of sugar metabolism